MICGCAKIIISQEIDELNSLNFQETTRIGAKYVDVTEITRNNASNVLLLADDQLHPSGKMYYLWVREIMLELQAEVEENM